MSAQITGPGQRMNFDLAADMINRYGYSVTAQKLTQSDLRCEVPMALNKSVYNIPILVNSNATQGTYVTEKRLNLTDVFLVTDIMIRVGVAASDGDAAFETFAYGNTTIFSTAGAAAAINGVYHNGFINVLLGNDQVIPNMDLLRFYKVPYAQQQANMYYSASAISQKDATDGATDGQWPIQPNIVLTGNGNIQFQLNTIVGQAAIQTGSRWIVKMRGVLAQNASKIAS